MSLCDPLAPDTDPEYQPVWAYPSFLKRFRGKEMREVWQPADEAQRRAESVEVWGYSLPESDSAVRVLLNVLRNRLKREKVYINVHNFEDRADDKSAVPMAYVSRKRQVRRRTAARLRNR
jgi:hypothetical protein